MVVADLSRQDAVHATMVNDRNIRRNISIFSRRGTESPPPTSKALMASSMSFSFATTIPTFPSPIEPTRQQARKWGFSRRSLTKPAKGTILRAVPREPALKRQSTVSALEMEMAVSPNEEILRNIGVSPVDENASETSWCPPSWTPLTPIPAALPQPLYTGKMMPRPSMRRRSTTTEDSVIGVWAEGKTVWSDEHAREKPPQWERGPSHVAALQAQRPGLGSRSLSSKSSRPSIKVVIPDVSSPAREFSFKAFGVAPKETKTLGRSVTVSCPPIMSGRSPRTHCHVASDGAVEAPYMKQPVPRKPVRLSSTFTANIQSEISSVVIEPSAEARPSLKPRSLSPLAMISSSASTSSASIRSNSDNEGDRSCRSSRTSMSSLFSQSPDLHESSLVESQLVRASSRRVNKRSRSVRFSNVAKSHDDELWRTSRTLVEEGLVAELEGSPVPPQNLPRISDLVSIMRTPSINNKSTKRMSSRRGNLRLHELRSRSNSQNSASLATGSGLRAATPTFGKAVDDLEFELRRLSGSSHVSDSSVEVGAISDPRHAAAVPAIPSRSPKRNSGEGPRRKTSARIARAPTIRKKSSLRKRHNMGNSLGEEVKKSISTRQASTVIVGILESLETLDDLFNTVLLNKAFYRIFKRNEVRLIRTVMRNMSPAAWEHRQMPSLQPTIDRVCETSPNAMAYLQTYKADSQIISALQMLLLQRCRAMLRNETALLMATSNPYRASRVDQALWRIWTFCQIFGYDKGREEDLVAQMDWLKGGKLAHEEQCSGTISCGTSLYLSAVLLNAPHYFGKGNGTTGLNEEDLLDMIEVWDCLAGMVQSALSSTMHAKACGVFEGSDIEIGNTAAENVILEEYQAYVLTFGLPAILEVITNSTHAFEMCKKKNWAWAPPNLNGLYTSRKGFLREALSRMYEERLCEKIEQPAARLTRMRTVRQQGNTSSLPAQLRRSALNGVSIRASAPDVPLRCDIEIKRPTTPRQKLKLKTTFEPKTVTPPRLAGPSLLRPVSPAAAMRPQSMILPTTTPKSSPPRVTAAKHPSGNTANTAANHHRRASSSTSYQSAGRDTSSYPNLTNIGQPTAINELPPYQPSIDSHRSQVPRSPTRNSVDHAISQILDMGFSLEQAKGALKITDMGDGLRVDRAVEYLLRVGEGNY